jgi:hypothetical protein
VFLHWSRLNEPVTGAMTQAMVSDCLKTLIHHRQREYSWAVPGFAYGDRYDDLLLNLIAWAPSPEEATNFALQELAALRSGADYRPTGGDFPPTVATITTLLRQAKTPDPALVQSFYPILAQGTVDDALDWLPFMLPESQQFTATLMAADPHYLNHLRSQTQELQRTSPRAAAVIHSHGHTRLHELLLEPPDLATVVHSSLQAANSWYAICSDDDAWRESSEGIRFAGLLLMLQAQQEVSYSRKTPDQLSRRQWPNALPAATLVGWINQYLIPFGSADADRASAAGQQLTLMRSIGPDSWQTEMHTTLMAKLATTENPWLALRVALLLAESPEGESAKALLLRRWHGEFMPSRPSIWPDASAMLSFAYLPFPENTFGKHWKREVLILGMVEELYRQQPDLIPLLAPLWQHQNQAWPLPEWEAYLDRCRDLLERHHEPALVLVLGYELAQAWALTEPLAAEKCFGPYWPDPRGSLAHLWCAAATINHLTPWLGEAVPGPFTQGCRLPDSYNIYINDLTSQTILSSDFTRIFMALLSVQRWHGEPSADRSLVALLLAHYFLEDRESVGDQTPTDFAIFTHPLFPRESTLLSLSQDYRQVLPWTNSLAKPSILSGIAKQILSQRLSIPVGASDWPRLDLKSQ